MKNIIKFLFGFAVGFAAVYQLIKREEKEEEKEYDIKPFKSEGSFLEVLKKFNEIKQKI